MSHGPADEAVHAATGPGENDSVTFSWGDDELGLFGSVRVARAEAGASLLALLFAGGEVASASVEDAPALEEPDAGHVTVGGVEASIEVPLESWRVRWAGDGGGWDLAFSALTPPLATSAGGLEGYEQGCRVSGRAWAGGREVPVDCLGQRGHAWGVPRWEDQSLSRTLSAWLGPDAFVALRAVRPVGAEGHADEQVEAWVVTPEAPAPRLVEEARLSTTYDEKGHQRRAGLELWPEPDSRFPQRVGGEARCGTSLALGRLRLDAAFFAWRMDGRRGVGRYDVLRRA